MRVLFRLRWKRGRRTKWRPFSPASRSRPYAYRQGTLAKSFRVTLGGIEIEYCQPTGDAGYLADALSRFGPGVAAIEFSARIANSGADSDIHGLAEDRRRIAGIVITYSALLSIMAV